MAHEIDMNDAFARAALAGVAQSLATPHYPAAHYNADGDCIEVLFSGDDYRAERISGWLTLLVTREDGRIVGLVIKRIREFIRGVLQKSPGFEIEINDGRVRLVYLLTAVLWDSREHDGAVRLNIYRKLREEIETANIELDLRPCSI